jgi:hypothetical protein
MIDYCRAHARLLLVESIMILFATVAIPFVFLHISIPC